MELKRVTGLTGWIKIALTGAALLAAGGGLQAQTPPPTPSPDAAPQVPTTQAPAATATASAGTIHGSVTAGTVPLPGVAITATNTLTGKKFATTTDVDGNYSMTIPGTGRYVVRAELAAFASVTHEVRLTADTINQVAEFSMQLASKVAADNASAGQRTVANLVRGAGAAGAAGGRGPQALTVNNAESGLEDATTSGAPAAADPSLANLGAGGGSADASDAIVASGVQGTTNGLANINEDQLRQRMDDVMGQVRAQGGLTNDQQNAVVSLLGGIMAGGGFGGPGGGPGGQGRAGGGPGGRGGGRGGGGGGNFRNFNPAQPHGSVFYQGGNSALNSAPWSPTLVPETNPSAYSNRFGVSIAGTPYIPGLTKPDTRQFAFINLTGQKNLNAFLPNPVRVPTPLERVGNFSQSFQEANGALVPVSIYNPVTGLPFAGNIIPACTSTLTQGCLTPQAQALLNYYPAPNINVNSTDPTVYNYQTISNAGSNNVAINGRYQRQLGQAQPGGPFGGRGGGGGQRGQRGQQNAPPVLRQNINASYNYSHAASDNRNIFLPLGGTTFSDGNAVNLGYTVSYGRLTNNASLNWNRSNGETRNYFTDTNLNPAAAAGICVPNGSGNSACGTAPATIADPRFYNGLPSIGISNFAGLSNQTPAKTSTRPSRSRTSSHGGTSGITIALASTFAASTRTPSAATIRWAVHLHRLRDRKPHRPGDRKRNRRHRLRLRRLPARPAADQDPGRALQDLPARERLRLVRAGRLPRKGQRHPELRPALRVLRALHGKEQPPRQHRPQCQLLRGRYRDAELDQQFWRQLPRRPHQSRPHDVFATRRGCVVAAEAMDEEPGAARGIRHQLQHGAVLVGGAFDVIPAALRTDADQRNHSADGAEPHAHLFRLHDPGIRQGRQWRQLRAHRCEPDTRPRL